METIRDKTYNEFESYVKSFSTKGDFEKNKDKIKTLRISSYEIFIEVLKLGTTIPNAVMVCQQLRKLSTELNLPETNILQLTVKFSYINALISATN